MSYRSFLQYKNKTSPKLAYNSNILKNPKNNNIFGMNGLIKKNRDITPLRKYNQKKKTNIIKNNKFQHKNLKIEGDLINGASYGIKRAKTPINDSIKRNASSKSPINKSKMNLLSLNNSTKLNKNIHHSFIKSNSKPNFSRPINYYYSPLNRSTKMNFNRSITPNNKKSIKNNNNSNNKQIKFNRSTTPIPKSKINLKNNYSKIGTNNFGKAQNHKLKLNGLKNKNFLSSNLIPKKNVKKNGLNTHYNNIFKSKNIFSFPGGYKNKPKVITINLNINQNFLSASSKNINNNEINNTKTTPQTPSLIDQNNNNTNNTKISNSNSNIGNINSSSSNVLNKFNDISQIESNTSIIINGIQNKNNNSTKNDINKNEETPKQTRKKILCMHEFSKTGYAGEDEKKVNQDNYFVFRNFMNDVNYIFMAVCDGHGAVGQEISNFLKENLPIDLNHALKNKNKNLLTDDISDIITDIFIKENTKLISNEMINSMLSGSTCVSTIYTPIKLITANVGDSRIILGKFNQLKNKWESVDLTRDHKPSLAEEEKRILSKGGRIEPMRDEDNSFIGPPRVWLKDQDYPGLAMSRSFGDRVAHSVGVSELPEIKEYNFCKEDKFFVVASDGLFEFISSQTIVEIIKDYYLSGDIVGCCEYLYELSRDKWMKEEEVVDDITMILVFLEDE